MSRIIIAVCFVMVFFSCKPGDGDAGPHLSREVMQKVMLDVNLAEAYSISVKDSLHKIGQKNVDSLSAYYQRIFDHYKITEQEFNTSLDWYKYHPAELDSIYAKMIPIVSNWQSHMPPVPVAQQAPAPPNAQLPGMHRLPAPNEPPATKAAVRRNIVPQKSVPGGKTSQN